MKARLRLELLGAMLIPLMVNINGCGDSSTGPAASGRVTLNSKYTSSMLLKAHASPTAVDSIKITRARFVLKRIKFETRSDSIEFKTNPLVLELDLTGAIQTMAVSDVPFGSYREIEFKVHRIESIDLQGMSPSETAPFADFLAGERYSMIIEGTVYKNGGPGQTFVFRSRVDAKQEHNLIPELVISETTPTVNVTMLISSFGWFRGIGGALVDPSDRNNENLIGDNLKASIRIFKDNNRDGKED